jgi:hypothetical protein
MSAEQPHGRHDSQDQNAPQPSRAAASPDRPEQAPPNPWAKARPGGVPAEHTASKVPALPASEAEVADFVAKVKALSPAVGTGAGRLLFAMDATMSRQPAWDMALSLQGEMFKTVKEVGGLSVQLVYFRGYNECRASRWVADPEALARLMTTVSCQGGNTQIGKVLSHARREMEKTRVHALVYVGDCMEEDIDALCAQAGELGLMGLPLFLFQEGHDARAAAAFRELARLTRGATCRFDQGSARQLRELLTAVAAYAAGGHKALERLAHATGGHGARLLIEQMRR